jgi:hypothetical protein
MGTIPVTVIVKDVHINVRGKVDICSGYDEQGWRRRNHKRRWRWETDPDIDAHLGSCSVGIAHTD